MAPFRDMDSASTKCISRGEQEGSQLLRRDVLDTHLSHSDHIIYLADMYTVRSESKGKELEESQPFVLGIKLHGPKGEIVRLKGVFDDGAMISAIDSGVFEKIRKRLNKVGPLDRLLHMVNGTIVPSGGKWKGTVEVCGVRREGVFEIFPSGGTWALLFGKPLMKVFQMEHRYVDDTISMHAKEMELRVENEFNHTCDCQMAAAAGVCLTADIKQHNIRKEDKRPFSRKGNVQWRARPNRQQI